MRTMSGEVEPRGEEDFGSDDADAESYLEEDNSSELMDRLRELEAENSALMLANENQREAYERCLDEVANHVVQALLNQKDLREECIKLKMLVFDLERQNRALCELFQQKLPHQSSTQYQLLPGLLPECNAPLHNDSAKPVETAMTEAQAKQASPGPRGPAAAAASSMEALSPFFKKKAHILEVLRKMEETDPLKFRPSPGGGGLSSFCDYSQALMSAEAAALAAAELPLPAPCKPRPCRCPCAESEATHVNGEVATATAAAEEGSAHGRKGVADGPAKLNRTQNHVISTAALSDCHGNSTTTAPESPGFPLKPAAAKDQHQQQPEGADSYLSITTSTDQNGPANQSQSDDCREPSSGSKVGETTGEAQEPEADGLKGDRSDESGGGGEKSAPQMSYCEMAGGGEVPRRDLPPASTPEKDDSSVREGPDATAVAPERPDLGEVAGAAASVSSPSKLLKFLKIPSMGGERRGQGQGAPNPPVRLSPQLTRTSRIPCRTNNYEVYHSPVPSRRATTTERCRPPPPPPPARSESYPATHSAPTSPPQQPPDELRPLPAAKELSYAGVLALKANRGVPKLGPAPSSSSPSSSSSSSSAGARVSPRVPHYENVSDLSTAGQQSGGTQGSLTRSVLTNHSSAGGGADRKPVTSLPEGSVGPPREQQQQQQQPASSSSSSSTSSSSSSDSSSEQDVDAEGAIAWRGRHSLPLGSSSSSSSSSAMRRTRDGAPDAEAREVTPDPVTPDPPLDPLPQAPPPPPTRRNDPSSIPRRAGHAPPRPPPALAESGHHAFKDRLAALGKLRGSEEPQGAAGPRLVDAADGVRGCDEAPAVERGVAAVAESPPDDLAADEQRRHAGFAGSLDGKARNAGGAGLKCPPQLYEPGGKPLPPSGPPGAKQPELEALYSRVAVGNKTDSPKSRLGLPSPTAADTPQLLRNHVKCPGSLNLGKPGPGGAQNSGGAGGGGPSPGKVPPKSPSKPGPAPSSSSSSSARAGGRPSEAPPRYSSKSEERSKIGGNNNRKKNPSYGDSLPPPPPRPPAEQEKPPAPVLSPQSAIEKKVMRGIEENMLKLQEMDRGGGGGGGGGAAEVKQKASNGIASWFGLKKSKLPALSRKGDAPNKPPKEEKREWRINIPSVGGGKGDSSNKMAARCREGVEGLNISTLMEKAEGLRRALEEERAYVDRSGRGHSCEVVMDQAQGQLAVMYRGGRSDNFMQQLLNRVDGKDVVPSVPQRRLSFDCKTSRPPGDAPGNHAVNHAPGNHALASDLIGVTTDENLAGSVHSQHFAGSGASTYTLDSGIGTFPLPDYGGVAGGRSLSKARPGGGGGGGGDGGLAAGSPGRVGRRSRTLERDMSSLEECYPAAPHKQLIPAVQLGPGVAGVAERSAALMHTAGVIHEDKEAYGAHVFTPRSKTWTFPSLKAPAAGGPGEVYLAVDEEEEEEEPAAYGSPFRGSVKPRGHPSSRAAVDPASLPVPAQSGLSRRGKSRTPSVPEMSREAGLELLRERPEEALSPSRPQVLETPESLSDSLYDSLSSCGSQG